MNNLDDVNFVKEHDEELQNIKKELEKELSGISPIMAGLMQGAITFGLMTVITYLANMPDDMVIRISAGVGVGSFIYKYFVENKKKVERVLKITEKLEDLDNK